MPGMSRMVEEDAGEMVAEWSWSKRMKSYQYNLALYGGYE